MICSFLIPTYKRPVRLLKTIKSIQESASENDFEIILHVATHDEPTIATTDMFNDSPNIRRIIAENIGYGGLNKYYTRCAKIARAPWVWIFNDDATLFGNWSKQLKMMPEKYICHAQVNYLNSSRYRNVIGSPFPVVPVLCWEKFGFNEMQNQVDTWLDKVLRIENGWQTKFLQGVTIKHERIIDECLTKER